MITFVFLVQVVLHRVLSQLLCIYATTTQSYIYGIIRQNMFNKISYKCIFCCLMMMIDCYSLEYISFFVEIIPWSYTLD